MKTNEGQKQPADAGCAPSAGSAATPQKKNYEVLITAYALVLVIGAEDEEKAFEYASDACSMGDLEFDSSQIEREVPDALLDNARKTADVVAEDE